MNLSSYFFETNVSNWNKNKFYKTLKALETSIKVVNDVVERGVTFMKEYNTFHTTDGKQTQYLLLVVNSFEANIKILKILH